MIIKTLCQVLTKEDFREPLHGRTKRFADGVDDSMTDATRRGAEWMKNYSHLLGNCLGGRTMAVDGAVKKYLHKTPKEPGEMFELAVYAASAYLALMLC